MTMDIEVLKLLVAVVGGILVVWYWNGEKQRLEQFRYVDDAYIKLLDRYFEHPKFGDPTLTRTYAQSFAGDEGLKYRYFAMAVHTVMETLFDLHKPKMPKWLRTARRRAIASEIPEEWMQIFTYHTKLHVSWLNDNPQLHEPAYVAYVNNTYPAKGRTH